MNDIRLLQYMAQRDARGPRAGVRLFLACLILGVGILAALGTIQSALVAGLQAEGQHILGADVQLRLTNQAATPVQQRSLQSYGRLSQNVQLRSMIHNAQNSALVEVKAVDAAYPLYGEVKLTPPQPLATALTRQDGIFGAVVEKEALLRLQAQLGDIVQLGQLRLRLVGRIDAEPDRLSGGFSYAPRVLIADEALASSGLLRQGSRQRYYYNLRLAQSDDRALSQFRTTINERFPDAGWRLRDARRAAPSLEQAVQQFGGFLSLIGLTSLLIAAIGIGAAMWAYLQSRQQHIAIYKALGASHRQLLGVYGWASLRLIGAALILGVGLGGAVSLGGLALWGQALPLPVQLDIYWFPLLRAALFGVVAAYAFLLIPLGRALVVSPALLFRGPLFASHMDNQSPKAPARYYLAAGACALVLIALALSVVNVWWWAALVLVVLGICYSVLVILARILVWIMRFRPQGLPLPLRLACANLTQPSAPVRSFMLSFGLAVALLVAVGLTEANFRTQLQASIPQQAPAFVFMDIPSSDITGFTQHVQAQKGFQRLDARPFLLGRITAMNDIPVAQITAPPEEAWVLRGDRVVSYAATQPEDSALVAGEWWPADYRGTPLVSLADETARAFQLELGDTISLSVLGRTIRARIANMRKVDWSNLQMDFVMIFSPEPLSQAPHSFMMTTNVMPAQEANMFRAIVETYPTVTVMRIQDVILRVGTILGQLSFAIRLLAVFTFVAGLLVLAGTLASGHRVRLYDAVVSKIYGATQRQLLSAYIVEYLLMGIVAVLVATAIGIALAWGASLYALRIDWAFDLRPLWGLLPAIILGSLCLGLAGTYRALLARPAPMLREL